MTLTQLKIGKITRAVTLGALLLWGLATVGCSKSNKHKGAVQTLFVHGDPMELVSGATFNPQVPFTAREIPNLGDYQLVSATQLTEKGELVKSNAQGRNLEAENAPTKSSDRLEKVIPFAFKKTANNLWAFASSEFTIEFQERNDGSLQAQRVFTSKESHPVEAIHYSATPGLQMFSMLVVGRDEKLGKVMLVAYWLRQGSQVSLAQGNKSYNYTWGPGVLIPWDNRQEVTVNICGSSTQQYADLIREAVLDWNHALASRLKVNVQVAASYPPFSDLNFHCTQMINNFLIEHDQNVAFPGMTLNIPNRATGYIQDSDIFLWASEFAKYKVDIRNPRMAERFMRIARHEFGHLLGLDHMFDGTESIMSYNNREHVMIYNYDRQAIRELYPLIGTVR